MRLTKEHAVDHAVATPAAPGFNYSKLQAAACMLASAAVSIGLTWYAVTRFF